MSASLGTGGRAVGHADIAAVVARMRAADLADGPADLALRQDRLTRAVRLLADHHDALADAMNADFGGRSRQQSLLSDVLASIRALEHARDNVAVWMRPDAVPTPFPGGEARIEHQPLGVVGIISPWNFPLNLAFGPLAGIFAAGNRALLKPSEATPRTAELTAELVDRAFGADEFVVVLGDASVGAAFAAQAFDHLIFTGSAGVARHVMRAAAEHLVPVTLELGGKSPVLISAGADPKTAAERIMAVKTFNVGQICLAPDYVLLPQGTEVDFVAHARAYVAGAFATLRDNPDYTAIIDARNHRRLLDLLADARAHGATVIELNPADEDLGRDGSRKIAPTLVLGGSDDMRLHREEIFGPILPIRTYRRFDEAVAWVNAHPRPLAAYYFGSDADEMRLVAERTTSGALVIDDVMTHVFLESLPFGGIGASGMGAYHGHFGFLTFSHAKPILRQSAGGESNLRLRAPYGPAALAEVKRLLAR